MSNTTWKKNWIQKPHPLVVTLVFIASLVMLWQGVSGHALLTDQETRGTMVEGRIIKIVNQREVPVTLGSRTRHIQDLLVRIQDPTQGEREVPVLNDLTPLVAGDRIYVNAMSLGRETEAFVIIDVRRSEGLIWLFAGFAALVLGVSGFKGINALVGMLFSVAVIFGFVVPGVLQGADPVSTGLIAAAVILIGTFYVSYGFDGKSVSALIGIVSALVLVAGVGYWVVGALHFTGYGDENAIYLMQETQNAVDLIGLVVAGIIIAAIGVLDDVAITQSSTVYELAKASPVRGWKLFRHAMEVGTDHISGVINTLVLAYAGASLPLILLLRLSAFPLSFSLGGEMVAQEIVRTLVSSAGLVLAVPLTTAVAVLFVDRWGVEGVH